jgi:uncharacterized protein
MSEIVRVNYRKFDGSLHWNLTMRRLGEDEHGVWLGLPRGGTCRKGTDGPLIVYSQAHVILFPRDAWWTATFNAEPERAELYCDITTPPRWPTPDEVTMVDLDLDVVRERDRPGPRILDEDEFAEHQVRYGYPADVIDEARRAADWLYRAAADGTEPFAGRYRAWLALVD